MWSLRPHRIDDIMYLDTFFSNISSIISYKCFQIFTYKCSKFERIELMRREVNAPDAYEYVVRGVGSPTKIVTYNDGLLT